MRLQWAHFVVTGDSAIVMVAAYIVCRGSRCRAPGEFFAMASISYFRNSLYEHKCNLKRALLYSNRGASLS